MSQLVEKHLVAFENADETLSPESVKATKGANKSKHSTVPSLWGHPPLTWLPKQYVRSILINSPWCWCWCYLDSPSLMILLPRIPCLCSSHPSTELPWSPLLWPFLPAHGSQWDGVTSIYKWKKFTCLDNPGFTRSKSIPWQSGVFFHHNDAETNHSLSKNWATMQHTRVRLRRFCSEVFPIHTLS